MNCPKNKKHKVILIEYGYIDPYRYDGISEIKCLTCGIRYGRWTGRVLGEGEQEPPYGLTKYVTDEQKTTNR